MNFTQKFNLSTEGFTDIVDITDHVERAVEESGIKEGICAISCPGSTCGISTLEHEPGLIKDLKQILEEIAPMSDKYEHCKRWGDCNGYAHIRSTLMKPFLSVPVEGGKLLLGTWQQIGFFDFDNRSRQREITIKIIGE